MVVLQQDAVQSVRVLSSMSVLAFLAVVLRIFARLRTRNGLFIEDFLIIAALCLFYAIVGLLFAAILGPNSAGTSNINVMTLEELDHYAMLLYPQEILFVTAISVIKISILFFYNHIFTTKHFRHLIYGVGVVCTLWWIIILFIVIFQCTPVDALWKYEVQFDPLAGAKCLTPGKLILGLEITNVICDLLILALPVYMVRTLQMKGTRKLGVIGIFLLGGFVCVTSGVRAYYTYDPATGQPHDLGIALDWGIVQLAVAIVCACLPTYGPLVKFRDTASSPGRAWYSSLLSGFRGSKASARKGTGKTDDSKIRTGTARSRQSDYRQIDDYAYLKRVDTGERSSRERTDTYPMGRIQAQNEAEII